MTMTREEYVTFETAKLLKKAGFPQDNKYYARYNRHGQDWHMGDGYDYTLKPSQSMAMRWLREEKKLSVRLNYITEQHKWFADILDMEKGSYFDETLCSTTYEEACEDGIQVACALIIEKGEKI